MRAESAAQYLRELADALESGNLQVGYDGKSVRMRPGLEVRFDLEAAKRKDTQSIALNLQWAPRRDLPTLQTVPPPRSPSNGAAFAAVGEMPDPYDALLVLDRDELRAKIRAVGEQRLQMSGDELVETLLAYAATLENDRNHVLEEAARVGLGGAHRITRLDLIGIYGTRCDAASAE